MCFWAVDCRQQRVRAIFRATRVRTERPVSDATVRCNVFPGPHRQYVEAPFLSDPIIDWDRGCLRHLELVTSVFNAAQIGSSLSLYPMIRAGFTLSMTGEFRIGSQVSLYDYLMPVGSAWSGVQADSRGLAALAPRRPSWLSLSPC